MSDPKEISIGHVRPIFLINAIGYVRPKSVFVGRRVQPYENRYFKPCNVPMVSNLDGSHCITGPLNYEFIDE